MKKILLTIVILFSVLQSQAQSYKYAHYLLDTLSSDSFCGRGYVNQGNLKASKFIVNELKKNNVELINQTGVQNFTITINNIDDASLSLFNKDSVKEIGMDYIVFGFSPSNNIELINEKCLIIDDKKTLDATDLSKFNDRVIVLNQQKISYRDIMMFFRKLKDNLVIPKLAIVQGYDKLQYPISTKQYPFVAISLKGNPIQTKKIKYLNLSVKSTYYDNYVTQNIWAKVDGIKVKDSCFMIVSHYDHLGMCSKAIFPGASDNASGTSVNLDLAQYYAKNPQDYTMIFLFCSAEEIGLIGSQYAASNPWIDLKKVKFLLNLDMCGTGSEGVSVVNGKNIPKAAKILTDINDSTRAFMRINIGEQSCNSDHCPFVSKGVPAFFLFTMGKEDQEYHTIYDKANILPFTKHIDFCNLIKDFITTVTREKISFNIENQ